MKRPFSLLAVALTALLVFASSKSGLAVTPGRAVHSRFEDFDAGKPISAALSEEGVLSPAPARKKRTDIADPFLWSAVRAADGTLYVGSGHEGRIFKVAPDGQTSIFADLTELDVYALALDSHGTLFAAGSPEGKVYRIAEVGKPELFFDSKEKTIWALLFDPADNLYVATGEKGVIFRISPDKKSEVFCDTDEKNILSLGFDSAGHLLAGSESNGLLYRIDEPKRAVALYASGLNEIKSIVRAPNGDVYLACNGAGRAPAVPYSALTARLLSGAAPAGNATSLPGGGAPPPGASPSPSDPFSDAGDGSAAAASALAASLNAASLASRAATPRRPGSSSQIVRLHPDGFAEVVWRTTAITQSLVWSNDRLLVGAGDEGKLYSLTPDGRATVLSQLDERQITVLLAGTDGGFEAVTSSLGAVYAFGKAPEGESIYESAPVHAEAFSAWGAIRALGPPGLRAKFETRSGNTPKPDTSWFPWKPTSADGHIASEPAAHLQYRLHLSAGQVERVEVYYQPRNLPPHLEDLTVLAAGVGITASSSSSPMSSFSGNLTTLARQFRDREPSNSLAPSGPLSYGSPENPRTTAVADPNARAAIWTATDPNRDRLRFQVDFRQQNDKDWRLLDKDLPAPFVSWSTAGWPDGYYYLKVSVSDALDNLPGAGRTAELTSAPFLVDHTAPQITVSSPADGSGGVVFRVCDAASVLRKVEFSVDGVNFQPLLPDDGVLDAKEESFHVSDVHPGQKIYLRAEDELGNSVSAEAAGPP